jgi:hypothetical protein
MGVRKREMEEECNFTCTVCITAMLEIVHFPAKGTQRQSTLLEHD